MHTPLCAVSKRNWFLGITVLCALAHVSLPASADRINVKDLKKGLTKEMLRGRMDRQPDKSVYHLPGPNQANSQASSDVVPALPATIVSPFIQPSSRSNSMNFGFLVGSSPFTTPVGV